MPRSTNIRNFPLLWLLALLATVATFAVLSGCDTSDGRQHLDNPFDPNGSTGGDGLQIRATASPNLIVLTWNQPQNQGIVEYVLLRADSPNGNFEQLAVVPQKPAVVGSYNYKFPPPTQSHWFKAQAFNARGEFTLVSLAVAATVAVGPTVVVGDSAVVAATRLPELRVTANLGDSLLVAFDASFSGALRMAQAGPGQTTTFSLDLGAAAANDTFQLHVKAFDLLGESVPTVITLPVAFNPHHTLAKGSPARLPTRVNDLVIPDLGVINMRFAASEAELAGATWLPAADLYPGYELVDSANPQEIWAEYEGDFGFNTIYKLGVRPELLASAAYHLMLPDNRIVSTPTVTAAFSAGATHTRISENPNFATVPWQAYSDTTNFILSPAAGTKTVYVQFRNDWTQSTVLTDYCILVAQGPDVNIVAPKTGDVVVGGSTLMTIGTSTPGSGETALDSLLIDLGDGLGFREVLGSNNWQILWDVPTFVVDTDVTIRARAVIGEVAVTDFVTVTVSQVGIQIDSPLDGVSLLGGEPVDVSGIAYGILNGAPIDSVVVNIGAERFVAIGTQEWSVSWLSPVVAVDTPTAITATVWTDGETATDNIAITLTP